MKRVLFFMVSMMCASGMLFAEEAKAPEKRDNPPQTLFGVMGSDYSFSGYGALTYQHTRIGGHIAHCAGGRGGLIVNDSFVVGFSGMGVAYPTRRETLSGESYDGTRPYAEIGWGGLLLEYHFFPKSLFHLSLGLTTGAGGIGFSKHDDDSGDENHNGDTKAFFVIEPEIGAYVNLTRFCRLGVFVSYRVTSGADHQEFRDRDLRSYGASVAAQFGWF